MRRTTVLLIPLALAVIAGSLVAVTVAQPVPGDGQPSIVDTYANETHYLALPDDAVSQSDTVGVGIDAGLAVGIDSHDLQSTLLVESFHNRFDTAQTDRERIDAYDAVLSTVENRTDALDAHNRAMIRGYANGSVTADTFLRERAIIVAEASRLQGAISELRAVESETLGFDLPDDQQSRLRVLNGQLSVLRGPASEHVAGQAIGGGDDRVVYVESSTTGYVAAFVEGDTYFRETHLGSEVDADAADQFRSDNGSRLENARQRGLSLYPSTTSTSTEPFGSTYQFNAVFDGGRLTAFIDGGTTNAFRENLRVNVTTLPVSETLSTTNGTATLRVNRTFATGPMEVTLVDTETGEPVDGTVVVGDHAVGQTGDDGSRWVVEPRGDTQVRAPTDGTNLTIALSGS